MLDCGMLRWVSLARILVCLTLLGPGCAHNYANPNTPRYAGGYAPAVTLDTLNIVSFNVKFGRRLDLVIPLFRSDPHLRNADVILLQEMDARGTARLAADLGYFWVYYPATRHPSTGRDFGNAVLSREPIESDRKILLPHQARFGHTQRIAVAATIRVGGQRVRIYSLHLATFAGNGPKARRDQLETVLADADSFPLAVVGGDFNSETVPEIGVRHGYSWPTRQFPHTNAFWTFDHLLLRGLAPADSQSMGVVPEVGEASDHRPIWARLVVEDSQRRAQGVTSE
jgi:endonuclease/exonuclease/phosphatase family metal-dependent hydrolase